MSFVREVTAAGGSLLRRAALVAVMLTALVLGGSGISETVEHLTPATTAVQHDGGESPCGSDGPCAQHTVTSAGIAVAGPHAPQLSTPPLVASARRDQTADAPPAPRVASPVQRQRPADLGIWRT